MLIIVDKEEAKAHKAFYEATVKRAGKAETSMLDALHIVFEHMAELASVRDPEHFKKWYEPLKKVHETLEDYESDRRLWDAFEILENCRRTRQKYGVDGLTTEQIRAKYGDRFVEKDGKGWIRNGPIGVIDNGSDDGAA